MLNVKPAENGMYEKLIDNDPNDFYIVGKIFICIVDGKYFDYERESYMKLVKIEPAEDKIRLQFQEVNLCKGCQQWKPDVKYKNSFCEKCEEEK